MRKKIPLILVLTLAVVAAPLLLSATDDKPVTVDGGMLSGVAAASGVTSYKGIPFAAPPVGDLRWRPPQPAAKWSAVRSAAEFGASCTQDAGATFGPYTAEFVVQPPVSEDCLFLNVWTPAKSPSEHLPVMVWLYGGGFNSGSGSVAIYDGERLAQKGVVVVTLNYRVGPLGFLAYPGLTAESKHHSSGNYGILDQISALQWVQRNIAAFGGDAMRVTIFGQSAGAASVTMLMQSPLAKGLFVRAISESGPGLLPANIGHGTLAAGEQTGIKFAEAKGTHSLAGLRALPASTFVPAAGPAGGGGPSPIADGWVVPDAPSSAPQVPIITGMVADDIGVDGAGFGAQGKLTAEAYRNEVAKHYGPQADGFLALYPAATDDAVAAARKSSSRDRARISISLWAAQQRKLSGRIYTYYFDRAIPWPAHPEFGAFHTAEVPYVFENLRVLDRPWEAADQKLSYTISSYWVNFAATGDPNGKELPKWSAFDARDKVTMELGMRMVPMPIAETRAIAFFTQYLTQTH